MGRWQAAAAATTSTSTTATAGGLCAQQTDTSWASPRTLSVIRRPLWLGFPLDPLGGYVPNKRTRPGQAQEHLPSSADPWVEAFRSPDFFPFSFKELRN